MKKYILALGCLCLLSAGWMGGCAANKVETTKTVSSPENTATPTETVPQAYSVKKGDCLWAISGRSEIYGDSFEWPLIFKANRDQIADPDEISPGQVFKIEKGRTPDEVRHARQLASDTPKFKPHAKPRAALPLDYF